MSSTITFPGLMPEDVNTVVSDLGLTLVERKRSKRSWSITVSETLTSEQSREFERVIAKKQRPTINPSPGDVPEVLGIFQIVPNSVVVASDTPWETLGGFTANLRAVAGKLSNVKLAMLCDAKTDGATAGVRVVERSSGGNAVLLNSTLANTSGSFSTAQKLSTVTPSTGINAFAVQARRNGVTNVELRFLSVAIIEV